MKFVMFKSGVVLVNSEAVSHDRVRIELAGGRIDDAIDDAVAAGYAQKKESVLGGISWYGRSTMLELDATTVYPDWFKLYQLTGQFPQTRQYERIGTTFLLPFTSNCKDFSLHGYGAATESIWISYQDSLDLFE